MKKLGLNKYDKLCSTTAIDLLFSRGAVSDTNTQSAIAYPLRAVWRENPQRTTTTPVQFLISIPKKRLRHAVDRVTMRRRIREAYRLNRHEYITEDYTAKIDVAFVYIADKLKKYEDVEKSMKRLLQKITGHENNTAQ